MLHYMSSWVDSRDKGMAILTWETLFNYFHRFGDFFTIFVKFDLMEVKIKDIPLPRVV